MARVTRILSRIAPLVAGCALVLAAQSGSAQNNDTVLFTTRVPPNVLFILDNSGSMNNIVWHPGYKQGAAYGSCTYYPPSSPLYNPMCLEFPLCNAITTSDDLLGTEGSWSGDEYHLDYDDDPYPDVTRCGNTRAMFGDPAVDAVNNDTYWELNYLRWYFSDNADAVYSDIIATTNGMTSACLGTPTAFAKYRRARITAAKDVTRQVICETAAVAEMRYGLAKFEDGSDPQGGYVVVPIANYTAAHGTALTTAITQIQGETMTPLSETLYSTYLYFMMRGTDTNRPWGKATATTATRFPAYNRDTTGGTSGTVPGYPVTDTCQKHFVVLITDGEPTRDDHDDPSFGTDRLPPSFTTWNDNLIGDYYSPGDECERGCTGFGSEESRYLDDVAYFMHTQDFLPTTSHPGTQTLDVYTVGFTTNAVANDVLNRAALRGGGDFFASDDPDALVDAITDSLASIVAKSQAFTSAAVPASRTTAGDNFYSAFFVPILDTPFWSGHLKNFDFSATGEVLTPAGNCAIGVDPSAVPPCDATGALRTAAPAFWDAALAIPAPSARKLYVELGNTGFMAQPTALLYPTTATEQDTTMGPTLASAAQFGVVIGDYGQAPYSSLPSSGNTIARMASALARYIRGCTFAAGPACTARVDGSGNAEYLGDIFHSNPVVVGSPNQAVNEATYQTFAQNNRTRPRVIYAGANDGYVHGFQAGTWDTSLNPDGHNRGTGQELMGFMPYGIRKTMKEYIKTQAGIRTKVTVDGSPVVADVWLHRKGGACNTTTTGMTTVCPALTSADKTVDQWRTVLMQGLRDGGQSYHALDITDPPALASTATTTYPRFMWGFPAEDAILGVNGGTNDETFWMANSWSEPVITRVKVWRPGTTPTVHERWVAIFGGGYHVEGDPNGTGYVLNSREGRAIYMVDITSGEVLAKKNFTTTAVTPLAAEQQAVREMRYAFASAPAVFDLNFDGYADVIYIGDLGGNLWKWVVQAPGYDTDNIAPATSYSGMGVTTPADQPAWPFRLFFRGNSSVTEAPLPPEMQGLAWVSTTQYQSFFFPPTGVLRSGQLVLAFGAGERAEPLGVAADIETPGCATLAAQCANNNHYYVVKDDDPLEKVGTLPNRITGRYGESDLLNPDAATPPTCAALTASRGYMITARDGEKFVSNSTIFLGTVFTGSFLPNPSAATCDSKGTAWIYAFDLDCGVGEFPGPGDAASDRRLSVGSGLPTRPRVSVGDLNQGGGGGCPSPPCCINKVVIVTSDGEIYNDCKKRMDSSGVRVRAWRER